MYDLMHVKHLGTDQYFNGSVLWLLVYRILPGTAAENLQRVMLRAKDFWKRNDISEHYGNVKLSMFHNPEKPNDNFPKLKGRAAEVKTMTTALCEIWNFYADMNDMVHKQIGLALRKSARLDAIMTENTQEYKLSPGAAAEWQKCVFVYLACQSAAAKHFGGLGDLLFDVTPKSHGLCHLGHDCVHLNPRRGWCYAGEHMMHTMRTVGSSCCRGCKADAVSRKIMVKYREGMHLQMSSHMFSA